MSISVKIYYMLKDTNTFIPLQIPPEQYFDLEEGEEIEVDCIPLYNDILEYIPDEIRRKDVQFVRTEIVDDVNNKKRIFLDTYWNNQSSFLIERIDISNGKEEREIIIETTIGNNPRKVEIIRLTRKNGFLFPVLNTIVTDNPDHSQSEEVIE